MKKNIIKTSLLGTTTIMGALVACDNSETIVPNVDDTAKALASRSLNAKSIAISLSDEDSKYLSTIQKIADDIFKYPELATEFVKNPRQFFSKYGYTGEIALDDGYIRFLTAYSDEDVRNAIKNKNLKLVIKLCREKKIFENAKSKTGLIDNFNASLQNYDGQVQPYSWFWFAEWIAVASAYLGVQAAYNFSSYSSVSTEGIWTSLSDKPAGLDIKLLWNIIADDEPVKYVTEDNYKDIADEIFITLQELRPELFKRFSDEEIKNQVTASLYGTIL